MMNRSGLLLFALASSMAMACAGSEGAEKPGSGPGAGTAGTTSNVGGSGGQTPNAPPDGDVGFKPIHRLNNTEYNRTVAHLLGTTLTPADSFTIEEEAAGFNTVAEGLTMSPRQVADYFAAAFDLAADVFAKPDL